MTTTETIQRRRAEIQLQTATLTEQLAALRAEDSELAIAERVVSRLEGVVVNATAALVGGGIVSAVGVAVGSGSAQGVGLAVQVKRAPHRQPKKRTRHKKPSGLPTMTQMVLGGLVEARTTNSAFVPPAAVRAFIRDRWWSDVSINAVASTMWNMAKEGQLSKDGNLYALKNEAPAASTAGASESGPKVNGTAHQPAQPDNEHN
jgi:hypothetical protein